MNKQNLWDSAVILLTAIIIYALSAFIGIWAGDFEPTSWEAVVLSNASTVLYKVGHIPLATSAAPITSLIICELTNCRAVDSLSERDRDLLTYAIFGVLFVGLCFAR